VNPLRLDGLPARGGSLPAHPAFQAGTNEMTHLIQGLPALIRAVTKRASDEYDQTVKLDLRPYAKYEKDVQALRQINAVIKQYLDIDVTVRQEDIKEIADSIRGLQNH
jgi:hypothetical protein